MEKVKKDIPYFKNGCRAIRAPYFVNIEPTAKIPKTTDFGEPQRGITRAKTQFWKYYGIRESHVKLPICPELEARSWLKRSESQKPKPKARRMSVAGSGLYVVDNEVREMGSDFLTRINRTATVATIDNSAANVVASTIVSVPAPAAVDDVIIDACLAGPSGLASIGRSATINSPPSNTNSAENTQLTIRNNFNPFQRLANAPFRRRAQSVSEQVRQPDPPAEESIDFSKDLYPYPAQRTYRMRRSSSFVKLLDSEISSVIVESPIEQMVGPKVDEMTESNEPIDQAITDKTMDQANDMEVDQPNEPNDQTKIDEALNVANDMELAEPNEMTDPAISDEPFNENERSMRAVAKWVSCSGFW